MGIPPEAEDFCRSWIAAVFLTELLAVGKRRRPIREAFRRAVEGNNILLGGRKG